MLLGKARIHSEISYRIRSSIQETEDKKYFSKNIRLHLNIPIYTGWHFPWPSGRNQGQREQGFRNLFMAGY